ncbi:hypothetical protein BRDCF_p1740 [Bacteroidales bacterium CF]|nr:hypothetical protein BRDCF_p1740 [Bacteroidales bacterium CF]
MLDTATPETRSRIFRPSVLYKKTPSALLISRPKGEGDV